MVEAHPTTLEVMGDFGADSEEQKENFNQIEGEAYYARHGGDLNGGKNLPHVLVIGQVWVRQLKLAFFRSPYSGTLYRGRTEEVII